LTGGDAKAKVVGAGKFIGKRGGLGDVERSIGYNKGLHIMGIPRYLKKWTKPRRGLKRGGGV